MQPFEYTNRKGMSYYLHARARRDGTVGYTLKRSKAGAAAELPRGYEVVEAVNGQASVRRIRPRRISEAEEAVVRSSLAQRGLDDYRLEVKDDVITIFEPDLELLELASEFNPLRMMPAEIAGRLEAMLRERFGDAATDQYIRERQERARLALEQRMRYAPVMRFRLADRKRRLFEAARMTYRGEGGWRALSISPLGAAAKRYVKHLGRESFFELI